MSKIYLKSINIVERKIIIAIRHFEYNKGYYSIKLVNLDIQTLLYMAYFGKKC